VHHDTASARSWVQLRVRVVACTAVDDPPGRLSEPQAGVDRAGHDRIMTGRSLNRRVADLVLVSEDLDRLVREGPMSNFDIDVTRDGGWWMVHIPKLGGRTQARYPSEVEPMAREYIALSTGTPIDQVAINWRRCTL
jgi:hypothetical protein